MRALYGPKVWAGPIVYLVALLGTWLLANESARPWAVLLLIVSAVLAVMLWGRQDWISAFPSGATARTRVKRIRLFYLFGVTIAMLLVLAADLRYVAAPTETFGLASILWIVGMALLLCSAFFGSHLLWVFPVHHAFRVGQCGKSRFWPCFSSWRCSVECGT